MGDRRLRRRGDSRDRPGCGRWCGIGEVAGDGVYPERVHAHGKVAVALWRRAGGEDCAVEGAREAGPGLVGAEGEVAEVAPVEAGGCCVIVVSGAAIVQVAAAGVGSMKLPLTARTWKVCCPS